MLYCLSYYQAKKFNTHTKIFTVYINNGILFTIRKTNKQGNLAICNNMANLKGIMQSEISQRKTNTIRYHLYEQFKKKSQSHRNSGGFQGIGKMGRYRSKGISSEELMYGMVTYLIIILYCKF